MNIVEKIKAVLNKLEIAVYRINIIEKQSVEFFYIRHDLDISRTTDIKEISVTVYKDFEFNKEKMRGNASALIFPDMTDDEIVAALKNAYYAAGFVKNKYYDIPMGDKCSIEDSALYDLEKEAQIISNAIFDAENSEDAKDEKAFINSAEVFAYKNKIRIINSNGIDVSYFKYTFEGEFVAEAKTKDQDVEINIAFAYNEPETEALTQKVRDALNTVKDRAEAINAPKAGKYDVILTDECAASILDYYTARASGAYIYAGYSSFKIDNDVQGEDIIGEKLNIKLKAVSPYSAEGIFMKDRVLIENGILKTIPCGSRFGYYLGVEPTGDYSIVECDNASISLNEMKKGALQVAAFSDFQVDPLSGQFGGEIRLAYLYEETSEGIKVTKFTGGSVNGNVIEAGKDLIFSTERYKDISYNGPYAVKLKNVSVAGI